MAGKPRLRDAPAIATVLDHPLARAEEAVRLAQADARAARRLAASALTDAPDAETVSTAERALGLAAIELGRLDEAVAHLRRAIAAAEGRDDAAAPHHRAALPDSGPRNGAAAPDHEGLRRRAAEARMSLSLALTLQGATVEALAEADRAAPALDGWAGARLGMQRALILQKLGRLEEALAGYRAPLGVFRRRGDRLWEARLLCNRGVLQVYRGALGAAQADFRRAESLHEAEGQALAATQVRHNLGWLAARRGDVPEALGWYDRVEAEYREHGVPLALLLMDRAEVLLSARLAAEARDAARRAAAELESAGGAADLAEALLLAAHAELLAADPTAARAHATRAATAFARQHRPAWAALARAAEARAAWLEATAAATPTAAASPPTATASSTPTAATPASPTTARRAALEAALGAAQRAVRSLEAAGWGAETLDARLIAGQAALELGRLRLARRELALAGAARHRGPVQAATRAWHAEALLRLSRDDRRGAAAAVAAGLRALEAHQATLGATELRAHASGHGEELATLGLRVAMESGSPARVLAAAERRRAAALLLAPVRPPDDAELAAELAELRRVSAALDEALRDGRHDPALQRRQAVLEASVRRRTRRTRGGKRAGDGRIPALPELCEALGERALVQLVRLGGRLHAVTVADGQPRLRTLADAGEVDREVESLRFSLRSLAMARPGSRTQAAMGGVCAQVAERLDAWLIAPLRDDIGDRPLVLVPTGELHALPWSLLPSLAARPLTVAPSLRLWHRAAGEARAYPEPRSVLVAGPRLPAAEQEIAALHARHPDARCLTGETATVADVAAALDGADSAHIAAHGRFRDDNPLFCSLELADGALTVYDLERLDRAPRRLVLSSCESGLSAVRAGDELMGFTAAVLALGTATVIAAVVPVPDEATHGLMLALDEELAAGAPPALALVRARQQTPQGVAPAAFVCFGAG